MSSSGQHAGSQPTLSEKNNQPTEMALRASGHPQTVDNDNDSLEVSYNFTIYICLVIMPLTVFFQSAGQFHSQPKRRKTTESVAPRDIVSVSESTDDESLDVSYLTNHIA